MLDSSHEPVDDVPDEDVFIAGEQAAAAGGNAEAGTPEAKKGTKDLVSFGSLFRFATKLDGLFMFVAILMALAHGAITPLFSVVFGNVIKSFGPTLDIKTAVANQVIWFAVLGGVSFATGYFQTCFFLLSSERQTNRIRREYFQSLLKQDVGWYDAQEAGAVTARISSDVLLIREGLGEKVGSLFQFLAMFIGGFVVAFTYSWKLSLVCLAVVPLLAIAGAAMGKVIAGMSEKGQKAYAKAGGIAEEVISSVRTVAAFGGETVEATRYNATLVDAEKAGVKKGHAAGTAVGLTFFIMFGSYGLAFWYGSQLIIANELNAGTVVTTFFSIMIGAMALGQATPSMTAMATARGAAFEIFKTIDRVPTIDPTSLMGEMMENDVARGRVQFRNINFAYPTRPDALVLRDFDLTIEPGTTVALVGPSGCGKSTVMGLLQRFYDPLEGTVLVDGKDIKTLNVQSLRSCIGVVAQEPVLFDMTIAENISFGRSGATQPQIEFAAKSANAHDFISALDSKYQTRAGERGGQLSGGQKQRVAIARALIRNPKMLLLDEATSALDNKSEHVVQAALDNARRGRTTIVIAHRLSTIRDADVIVVVDGGRVIDQGTHDELLSHDGLYRELWEKQQAAQDDNGAGQRPVLDVSPAHSSGDERGVVKTSNYVQGDNGHVDDVEAQTVKEERSPLLRAAKMNLPEWPFLVIGVLSACGAGVIFPSFSLIFAHLLTDMLTLIGDKLKERAAFWALIFLALGGGACITNYLQSAMFNIAGERLTSRVRALLFTSIIKQDIGFFDFPDHRVGALATKLSTDATLIQGATSLRLGTTIQTLATLVSGLVIAFVACWKMSLVVLACIPVVALGGALHVRAMMGHTTKAKEAYEQCGTVASEAVTHIRTVTSLGRQDTMFRKYDLALRVPEVAGRRSAHFAGIGFGFSEGASFLVFGLAFWYGSLVVTDGTCELADMFQAIMAIVFGAMMAGQLSSMAPDAAKARTAAADMFKIVDRTPPIDVMAEDGDVLPAISGEVRLNDVVFRYPSRAEGPPILRGLSLTALPGQTVALVGASGCGKSTVVQLLQRFYDPGKGTITVDGRDTRTLNLHWLRRQIGFVQQEPVLFSGTIADNIRYGDPEATMEQIIEAATLANAHKFITTKLPDGYNTHVGERGSQLSGGQKQRVAIARALVRNPKVLLLDEATSALDSTSEKVVQAALDRARKGRTTIVIAHRLSTIQSADLIVVLDAGQRAEAGTHAELMARQQHYYQLIMNQAEPL